MTGPYVVRHLAQDERTGPSGEASHEMRVVSVKAFETLEEAGASTKHERRADAVEAGMLLHLDGWHRHPAFPFRVGRVEPAREIYRDGNLWVSLTLPERISGQTVQLPPESVMTVSVALPAEGGKVELPDGREIVVETTSWSDLAAAVDYLGRGFVREEEWPEVLAAFNAAMAERYGTEARA